MNGHVQHNHEYPDSIVKKWGTTFVDAGSIQMRIDTDKSESRLLEFKVGSREATIRSRDHSSRSWNTDLTYSFTLTYDFQMENMDDGKDGHEATFSIWVFSDIQPHKRAR